MDTTNNQQNSGVSYHDEAPKEVEKKTKPNMLAIIFGTTTIICAGLALFFGIEYFKPKGYNSGQPDNRVEETVTEQEDGNNTTHTSTIADEYKEVKDFMDSFISNFSGAGSITNVHNLAYKPDGLSSYVPMRYSLSVSFDGLNSDTLQEKLKEEGFVSVGDLPYQGSTGPQIIGYRNPNNIICGVYYNLGESVTNYLECAKTDWTWLTDEEKVLIGKLETAYYKKTGQYPTIIYGFGAKPKDSTAPPYQTLQVAIGGGGALFYRVSPEAEWQYFTGGQAVPECDEYNTEDLKKAFAGSSCYNPLTASDSTVQP